MKLIFGNRKLIEKRAAKLIEKEIHELLKTRKSVVLGSVGGRSVPKVFEHLKDSKIPWRRVHLFMIDERLVPIESRQSNFNSLNAIHPLLPQKNLHPYNPEKSVSQYYEELKQFGGKFDIILLSSGEDGHIASLFPNHSSIKNTKPGFIEISDSPKHPKQRISASSSLIRKSNLSILLFIGKDKREAYENFISPEVKIDDCPAKIVNTIKESYVLTDTN